MTLMDTIRKWNEKKKEKSSKFKEVQTNDNIQRTVEQRKKSSNERELEKYMEAQREKMITEQLKKIRKKETEAAWKGNMFGKSATITKTNKPILKTKNIFVDQKNKIPITNKGGMFFK